MGTEEPIPEALKKVTDLQGPRFDSFIAEFDHNLIGHCNFKNRFQYVLKNFIFSVKISIPLENTGVSSVFTALDWPFSLIFSLARRNEGNFFQAVPTTLSSSLAEVRLASLVAWA